MLNAKSTLNGHLIILYNMLQYANVENDIQDKLYELAGNIKNITLGASFAQCALFDLVLYSNRHIIIKILNHFCVILCRIITILI